MSAGMDLMFIFLGAGGGMGLFLAGLGFAMWLSSRN